MLAVLPKMISLMPQACLLPRLTHLDKPGSVAFRAPQGCTSWRMCILHSTTKDSRSSRTAKTADSQAPKRLQVAKEPPVPSERSQKGWPHWSGPMLQMSASILCFTASSMNLPRLRCPTVLQCLRSMPQLSRKVQAFAVLSALPNANSTWA